MPAFLRITSGGHVGRYAEFVIAEPEISKDFMAGHLSALELYTSTLISSKPQMVQTFQFRKADEEKLRKDFMEGIKYNGNAEKYGYTDWYPWANHYWGTKWGAYNGHADHTPGRITADFQSAWSPPDPVIKKLSELYPEVTVQHKFIDEGYGYGGFAAYTEREIFDEYNADDIALFG